MFNSGDVRNKHPRPSSLPIVRPPATWATTGISLPGPPHNHRARLQPVDAAERTSHKRLGYNGHQQHIDIFRPTPDSAFHIPDNERFEKNADLLLNREREQQRQHHEQVLDYKRSASKSKTKTKGVSIIFAIFPISLASRGVE
eukprot:TRINITY_DN4989_c0_g2_i1.p1 TRINITY_DN4989_c0_g2~~TRINITY_DN4989_c0_g2_i1.p1  ORF type:complete len:143 (+),score=13.39 TRINITY_DN4989_c0_g2_i1:47-475(+)